MVAIQKLIVLVCCCLLTLSCQWDCGKQAKQTVASTSPLLDSPQNDSTYTFSDPSEAARTALLPHCGSCHQSSLDSHKPGAIGFFDLDMGPDWHVNLKMENVNSLERRVRSNKSFTDQEKEAVLSFVQVKRDKAQ